MEQCCQTVKDYCKTSPWSGKFLEHLIKEKDTGIKLKTKHEITGARDKK